MSRGRKPNLNKPGQGNISPFPGGHVEKTDQWHKQQSVDLRPRGMKPAERKVWNRIGPELSKAGRMKALFVDVIADYCRIVVRLADARRYLDAEQWSYVTTGRHGVQHKSRPEVAQLNDDWRKWRSLVAEIGLSPASQRGLQQQENSSGNAFQALERSSGN